MSKNVNKRIYTSLLLCFLLSLIFIFNPILVFCLIVIAVMSIMEFLNMSKKFKIKNKINFYIINFFFIIYISVFSFMFVFFSSFLQLKLIIFTLLAGCAVSDIGGFIFGKIFKGPKLSKISPNKTIAGSLGSIILTSVFIESLYFYFFNDFSYKILSIAAITSLSCQIGDLFFSFLKRKAKIKDTGDFLPGHGGFLDRIDGILIGVPIGFLGFIFIF